MRYSALMSEQVLDLQVPVAELIAEHEQAMLSLHYGKATTVLSATELLSQYWDYMERRRRDPSGLLGLPTGLLDLDRKTLGLQPSDMIIIAGRPSMGKTALATWIAYTTAVIDGGGVLFFSLDMNRSKFPHRLLGITSGVPTRKIKLPHTLDDGDFGRVAEAAGKVAQAPLLFDDTRDLTVEELCSRARRAATQLDLALIIVDYVQLLRAGSGRYRGNRNAELTEVSRRLRALIGPDSLPVPMLVISQLSRQVEMRKNKRPVMADLRDSGSLEQEADQIWALYRESYYCPARRHFDVVEVGVLKNKEGETGPVEVLVDLRTGVWYDAQREQV